MHAEARAITAHALMNADEGGEDDAVVSITSGVNFSPEQNILPVS